jgi:hypothetical protein
VKGCFPLPGRSPASKARLLLVDCRQATNTPVSFFAGWIKKKLLFVSSRWWKFFSAFFSLPRLRMSCAEENMMEEVNKKLIKVNTGRI